ncbi:ABC transporter ATP-binding protein [Luteimicrobium sp. NPDC057192]|uniref:ABC transporter ATP-binding protein n=1 Tax=Luteimicrobium sp. NPDC057192 TaxID=3346042 RepID=UPI003633BBCB
MEPAAIDIRDLKKRFGRTQALDGLHLQVRRGSVHGFLGPNGAGKSTTIRILLGLVRPDAGAACLLGGDPWRDAVALHRRLAYVPGDVALWRTLTAGQCLDLLAATGPALDRARRAELLERFDLDPTRRAGDLSKGNRQKVALVAAFASDVDVLVLDEPTSGLDPLMEEVFQECVRERARDGATVLLSSHILGEVEALCDEVTIIRHGRDVTSGTLADLRRHTRTTVRATTRDAASGLAAIEGVADLSAGSASDRDGSPRTVGFTVPPADLAEALAVLQRAGLETLVATPPSLDELFLSAYASASDDGPDAAPDGATA